MIRPRVLTCVVTAMLSGGVAYLLVGGFRPVLARTARITPAAHLQRELIDPAAGAKRQPVASATAARPCPTRTGALFVPGGPAAFVDIHDGVLTSPPFFGMTGPHEPMWVQQFVIGRQLSYVTTRALHGRFRAALDRRAREMGYPIMKYPYVPLVGLIVRDSPHNTLEFYESVFVFRAVAGAKSWFASIFAPGSQASTDGTPLPALPRLGNQTGGYTTSGPNDNYEHVVYVYVRLGRVVVLVESSGGKDLSLSQAVQRARHAVAKMSTKCGRSQ